MKDTKLITRIGYSDLFPKLKNNKELLSRIDTELALELLVKMNKYENRIHAESTSELKFILNEWLADSKKELKDKIVHRYVELVNKQGGRKGTTIDLSEIKIINRIATLRTMEILISQTNINNITIQDKSTTLENMFKLYLWVNDEIADRQDILFKKWLSKMDDPACEIRFHLYLGLSHVEMTGEKISKKLMSEVVKFVLFEKWIKNKVAHNKVVEEFLQKVTSKDWYDYFSKVFHLNNIAINEYKITKNKYPDLWVILDYFSNHEQINMEWSELTLLRKQPLYQMRNGDYLILDFGFMIDKFFSGTYHDLIELSKIHGSNFHLDYSKEFVEETLLINGLRATFGKSYIQYSERIIKETKNKGINSLALPDYYMRNGNKVFVFECKNSFLSNDHKVSMNCDLIEDDIKKKFVDNLGKKKAIKQLLNFIQNSNDGKYTFFDNLKKQSNCCYYPVLVVTDNTLTSIGFNKLFNEYLKEELPTLSPDLQKQTTSLTIIHINDFLYYNIYLKKLDQEIVNYKNFIKNQSTMDSMLSFSSYLDIKRLKDKKSINSKVFDAFVKDSFLSK